MFSRPVARAGGAGGLVVQADRAGDAKVRTMVAAAVGGVGRFDLVVNNGGSTRAVPARDLECVGDQE